MLNEDLEETPIGKDCCIKITYKLPLIVQWGTTNNSHLDLLYVVLKFEVQYFGNIRHILVE